MQLWALIYTFRIALRNTAKVIATNVPFVLVHFSFLYTQDGFSSLYVACQGGHKEVVDTLLKNGANVDLATTVRMNSTKVQNPRRVNDTLEPRLPSNEKLLRTGPATEKGQKLEKHAVLYFREPLRLLNNNRYIRNCNSHRSHKKST